MIAFIIIFHLYCSWIWLFRIFRRHKICVHFLGSRLACLGSFILTQLRCRIALWSSSSWSLLLILLWIYWNPVRCFNWDESMKIAYWLRMLFALHFILSDPRWLGLDHKALVFNICCLCDLWLYIESFWAHIFKFLWTHTKFWTNNWLVLVQHNFF